MTSLGQVIHQAHSTNFDWLCMQRKLFYFDYVSKICHIQVLSYLQMVDSPAVIVSLFVKSSKQSTTLTGL